MSYLEVVRAQNSVGICDTCVKCGNCELRLDPASPVYECEEFDTGASVEFNNGSGKLSSQPATVAHPANGDLKGVCSDCDDQTSCVRGKHTGGIWDCDSYMEINR